MSEDGALRTLTFRCPKELEGVLPKPQPAVGALPDWLKTMPGEAFNPWIGETEDTVKRCPPFVDAMTLGFVIPLLCDVKVEKGEFTWDAKLPATLSDSYPRSPMGFHHPSQAAGTPLFDPDGLVLKFHNLWTIQAPSGYSLLFTHPANRLDLPFRTLTGLVDCDLFHDAFINFPAIWHDHSFAGVLERGTPIAQCVPIRREVWSETTGPFSPEDAARADSLVGTIRREKSVYRRNFRSTRSVRAPRRP